MTRHGFFAFLFGGAAAGQEPKWATGEVHSITPKWMIQGRELHWFSGLALNNQCPVCGTMAEAPYRGLILNMAGKCLANDYRGVPCIRAPRVLRCVKCKAAFWQDAEGEKP